MQVTYRPQDLRAYLSVRSLLLYSKGGVLRTEKVTQLYTFARLAEAAIFHFHLRCGEINRQVLRARYNLWSCQGTPYLRAFSISVTRQAVPMGLA